MKVHITGLDDGQRLQCFTINCESQERDEPLMWRGKGHIGMKDLLKSGNLFQGDPVVVVCHFSVHLSLGSKKSQSGLLNDVLRIWGISVGLRCVFFALGGVRGEAPRGTGKKPKKTASLLQRPVDPKPLVPRDCGSSLSTQVKSPSQVRSRTNWAMRMP